MKRDVIGCLAVCYAIAGLFLAAAFFGLPFGMGNYRGLRVLFSRDLVYTTGKVIRFDSVGTSSHPMSVPVIEYSVDGRRERFAGVGGNTTPFDVGDEVPVAYMKSDRETVYVRTFGQVWVLPLMMILFASPFLAMGIWGTYSNLSPRFRDR